MKVDYLKYDNCGSEGVSQTEQALRHNAMREVLKRNRNARTLTVPPRRAMHIHTISVSEGSHSVIQFFADMRYTNASS